MDRGEWIGISRFIVSLFPTDRPYGEHEALISVQLDYDNDKTVSVSGYAAAWKWSRSKVRTFLKRYGLEIEYAGLHSRQGLGKIKGHRTIQRQDNDRTSTGQVRFIDTKASRRPQDNDWTSTGQRQDNEQDTTINTNTKTETDINNIILSTDAPEKKRPAKKVKSSAVQPEPDLSGAIAGKLSRYTSSQNDLIQEAFRIIARCRRTGKVKDSVLLAEAEYWEKFPAEAVEDCIKILIREEDNLTGNKKERFLQGCLRNWKPSLQARPSPAPQQQEFGTFEIIHGGAGQPARMAKESWQDGYVDPVTGAVKDRTRWVMPDGRRLSGKEHEGILSGIRALEILRKRKEG